MKRIYVGFMAIAILSILVLSGCQIDTPDEWSTRCINSGGTVFGTSSTPKCDCGDEVIRTFGAGRESGLANCGTVEV